MAATPRLSLPFLEVGQSQKEFTHNEALQSLDVLVGGCVEEPPRTTAPAAPAVGCAYIVADGASGAWAGKSQCVAAWTSGGWRFIRPVEGVQLLERSSGNWTVFRNGAWERAILRGDALSIGGQQVVGARVSGIASPTGGTVIDSQARLALNAVLSALRSHGLIEP